MPSAIPTPARLHVPHQAAAPNLVRRWLREALPDLSEDSRDNLLVTATELVSNAVRHASPLPDGGLCVTLDRSGGDIEVRVVDGGAPTHPHVCPLNLESAHGRGMFIVSRLSTAWGTRTLDGGGQEVWARVPVRLTAC